MADQAQKDTLLGDPLSDVTRRERRALLGISAIALALIATDLVPTRISALGVEFSEANQDSLHTILALVISYFLAAFIIYGISDFLAWRRALYRQHAEDIIRKTKEEAERPFGHYEISYENQPFVVWYRPVTFLRAAFEFVLPILTGIVVIFLLLIQ